MTTVVLQKPQENADRLPPPRNLILDFAMTHPRYGRSHVNPAGQLTNIRRSDGALEPDGALKVVARKKIFIIANYTLIGLTPSPSCRLQLTHQAVFMMTFFVFYSCVLTVKHRL